MDAQVSCRDGSWSKINANWVIWVRESDAARPETPPWAQRKYHRWPIPMHQWRCLTKAEEPSLPYYLPIAGGRVIRFIPFPTVLVLCEMQSVSSRIWTRVAGPFPMRITITPWAPPVLSLSLGTWSDQAFLWQPCMSLDLCIPHPIHTHTHTHTLKWPSVKSVWVGRWIDHSWHKPDQ